MCIVVVKSLLRNSHHFSPLLKSYLGIFLSYLSPFRNLLQYLSDSSLTYSFLLLFYFLWWLFIMLRLFGNFSYSDCNFLFPYEIFSNQERIFKRVKPCKLEVLFAGMKVEYLML